VYVTACDLEKSSSFNKTVEITGHVRFALSDSRVKQCVLHCRRGAGIRKVSNRKSDLQNQWRSVVGHCYWCHSKGHAWFPITLPL